MRGALRTSIRLKLAVLVAGAVVLTAGALSVVSYSYAYQTLRREIHARLTVMAADRQKILIGYIEQQQERVALVASRTRLRQLLDELAAGTTATEHFRGESRQILRDAQRVGAGVKAIWIADPTGRVVTATDDSYLGQDMSSELQFVEGRTRSQVYLRHNEYGMDLALLSAPATVQPGDRLVGVVMMLTDARGILDAVSDRTGLGQSGTVMVGMRVNETIRYLLMSESGTSTSEVPASHAPAMVAATSGESGFKPTRDWRGVDVLAAYQPVGYRNWGVVTKIDAAEAYAPIASLRRLFVTIGGVVLLWGALIAYLLARRFTRPILQMASMAESIATGGLRARVEVESRDEIGKLGEAFNVMSEELAHSYAILEDRVNQRTGELQAERDLLQGLLDNIPDFI